MTLRPHHLLCTQGYSGKGYSREFIANMTALTNRMRSKKIVVFDLVFGTDDICAKCPNMLGIDQCKENEKVKRFDQKVAKYFGLKEKRYIYSDIIREINAKMTEVIMEDICSDCNWYPVSACKHNILNHYER